MHPDDQPAFRELLVQLQALPGSTHSTELRIRDADDTWRHVELILTNLLDDPNVAGMVATARDIASARLSRRSSFNRHSTIRLPGYPTGRCSSTVWNRPASGPPAGQRCCSVCGPR